MDFPACGLANLSEAPTCVCGHQFEAEKFPEAPDWHINLAWRQKVAAYWSISWPALVGWLALISFLTDRNSVGTVVNHAAGIALAGDLAFLAIQALLTRRIVRKNYRTFRVYVICEDGRRGRNLSIPEAVRVWLWILILQVALYATGALIVLWNGPRISGAISSLTMWLWFLWIGPYAIGLALRVKYPGFRLQACGYRYI